MKTFKKSIAILLATLMLITGALTANLSAYAASVSVKAGAVVSYKVVNDTEVSVVVGVGTKISVKDFDEFQIPKGTTFKTSNVKIAKISKNGDITAIKAGKVSITAIYEGTTYRCNITVVKVKLNKTKLTLKSGQTYQLKLKGAKIVSAKSGNSKIAKVNSKGKVFAKNAGTTTVTVKGNNGLKYKCKVTVKACLNKTSATLAVGDKTELKLKGAKVKSFKSSDKAIAVVDKNGVVTAKKKGEATIKVTDTKKKTYTCKIKVEKPSLNLTNLVITVGDTFNLKLKGNTQNVEWSTNRAEVATVSEDGVVSAKGVGMATITAKVASGHKYACNVTVIPNTTSYKVTFNSNGGTFVGVQTIPEGSFAIKPVDPYRSGYVFAGWYKDEDFEELFVFESERVYGNTTLYARWAEKNSDEAKAYAAFGMVAIGYSSGENCDSVKNNLQLPTVAGGAVVAWSSSNAEIVAPDGTVHRPSRQNAVVALTATIKQGNTTIRATYFVTVMAQSIS